MENRKYMSKCINFLHFTDFFWFSPRSDLTLKNLADLTLRL